MSANRVPQSGSNMVWIAMGAGILGVLLVAFWVIQRNQAPLQQMTVLPPEAAPDAASSAATSASATQPATTTRAVREPTRPLLRDIADPYEALEIYHLQRGEGDTIEIKARNRSKRGLFVKSVDLFAESNDRTPLANIGFWLPPGEQAVATREVLELSRRLGPDEAVKAVINEAEFRDEPPEELAEQSAAQGAAGTTGP